MGIGCSRADGTVKATSCEDDTLKNKLFHRRLELGDGESAPHGVVSNRWSEHLPDDLIEMLLKRLSLIDSVRFSTVCTSWKRATSEWYQRAIVFPWILKRVRPVDSATAQCSLYSPSEDTVYNFKFPRAADPSYYMLFLGCIDGYLIMSELKWRKSPTPYGWSINYLLNPITGARIMLPDSYEVPIISAASSNPRSSDCIIAAIVTPLTYNLIFCRPGDKSWTYQSGPQFGIRFQELQFHNGKLYAFANATYEVQYLVVFDPIEVFAKAKTQVYVGKQFEVGGLIGRHMNLYGLETYPSFMLASKGEILLVWDRYNGRDRHSKLSLQNPDAPFWVFKLDVEPEPELTETTLEDQTIFINPYPSFLGANKIISIPLSRITSSMTTALNDKAFNGLRGGNCIYYATNTTGHLVIGIYNLADGKTDYFSADNYFERNNDAPERVSYGLSWFPLVS